MVDGALLQEVLQEEAGILERMLDLEEETQYLLIKGEAKELEKLNMEKDKLIARLTELEEQRQKLFPAGVTLEQYLVEEKPGNRRELEEIRKILLQLHASLQKKLNLNRYLLRHNLHFTRQSINSLFPGIKDTTLYASSGEKNEQIPAGLVDSNV